MKIKIDHIENDFICDKCYNSDIMDEIYKYKKSTGDYKNDYNNALMDGTVDKILKKKCNHVGEKVKREYLESIYYGTIEIINIYKKYGKHFGLEEGLSFEYYQDYLNKEMRKFAKKYNEDLTIATQTQYKFRHYHSLINKIKELRNNDIIQ